MQEPPGASPAAAGATDSLRGLLRNRVFGFYVGARVAAFSGQTIQAAALAWQVYQITGQALPLALIGLFRFVPSIAVSFLAGAVADTRDRRAVIAFAQLAPLAASASLWLLTTTGTIRVPLIYALVALMGVAAAFDGPARASLLPMVVPRQSFQRAVAVSTTAQQLAGIVGPAAAGLIIAQYGVAPAYLLHFGILLCGLVCLAFVRVPADGSPRIALSLGLVAEGIAFMRTHPAVLGAMAIDMAAVIFASADALLPIYAQTILGTGASGYGMLISSKAVGAFVMAVALAFLPPIVSTGRTLVWMIAIYGLGTIAFGFSTSFPLSLLLYGGIAAFDQVSVVVRQSIIQLGTPDALRGRVSAVNSVFVGASNQLGAVESGIVATVTSSAVVACVSGGVASLVAGAIVLALIPSLWRHRIEVHATAPLPATSGA